ncbi:uncharacterized protein [Eurosta solidaginis]|uniref:uncharacterized protein n=1 Tax=Eurosta solidaginis TaxID=178769 RepID=UPI003531020C
MSHALQALNTKTGAQPHLPFTKSLGRRAQFLATKNWWKICFVYGHDPTKFYHEISCGIGETLAIKSSEENEKPKSSARETKHKAKSVRAASNTGAPAAPPKSADAAVSQDSRSASQRSLNDYAKLFPRNMPSIRRSRRRIGAQKTFNDALSKFDEASSAHAANIRSARKKTCSKIGLGGSGLLQRVDSSCHKTSVSKVRKLTLKKFKAPYYSQKHQHYHRTPFTDNNTTLMSECEKLTANTNGTKQNTNYKQNGIDKAQRRACKGSSALVGRQALSADNATVTAQPNMVKARCHRQSNKQEQSAHKQQQQEKTTQHLQIKTQKNQQQHPRDLAPLKLSLLPHEISLDASALSQTLPAVSAPTGATQATNSKQLLSTIVNSLPSPSAASQTHSQQSSFISYDFSRSTSRQSCFESLPNERFDKVETPRKQAHITRTRPA